MTWSLDLLIPPTVPTERFLGLMYEARQTALQIEGVYDLALYQSDRTNVWRCNVEVQIAHVWESLIVDPHFRQLWAKIKTLGVGVLQQEQLLRQI